MKNSAVEPMFVGHLQLCVLAAVGRQGCDGGGNKEGLVAGRGFKCRTNRQHLSADCAVQKGEFKFRHPGDIGNRMVLCGSG